MIVLLDVDAMWCITISLLKKTTIFNKRSKYWTEVEHEKNSEKDNWSAKEKKIPKRSVSPKGWQTNYHSKKMKWNDPYSLDTKTINPNILLREK